MSLLKVTLDQNDPRLINYPLIMQDFSNYFNLVHQVQIKKFGYMAIGFSLVAAPIIVMAQDWLALLALSFALAVLTIPQFGARFLVPLHPANKRALKQASVRSTRFDRNGIYVFANAIASYIGSSAKLEYVLDKNGIALFQQGSLPAGYFPRRVFSSKQWDELTQFVTAHYSPIKNSRKTNFLYFLLTFLFVLFVFVAIAY